jgi:ABC-type multidrug transport system ATPase subunit
MDRKDINYSHYMAYVQQDDILLQSMTVRECLMFAAKMKLHSSIDKEARVQELMDSLKLNK